jgi:hypothetical protein
LPPPAVDCLSPPVEVRDILASLDVALRHKGDVTIDAVCAFTIP